MSETSSRSGGPMRRAHSDRTGRAPHMLVRFQRLAVVAPLAVIGIAMLALIGWVAHVDVLTGVGASSSPMRIATAVAFVTSSVSLLAIGRGRRHLATAAAAVTMLIGVLALAGYVTGTAIGVDELMRFDRVFGPDSVRIAPNTAVAFTLLGVALIAILRPKARRLLLIAVIVVSIAIALGIVSLIGYLVRLPSAYEWGSYTGMSLNTAVCMTIIGIAVWGRAWLIDSAGTGTAPRWAPVPLGVTLSVVAVTLAKAVADLTARQSQLSHRVGWLAGAIALSGFAASIMAAVSARAAIVARAREQEVKLQRSRNDTLMATLDELGEGIVEVDEGVIVFANAAATTILQRSRDDLVGTRSLDLIWPDDRDEHMRQAAALEGGLAQKSSYEIGIEVAGKRLDAQIVSKADEVDPRRHVTLFRDISERKQLERVLEDRDRILLAVVDSAQEMLRSPWRTVISDVLARIGSDAGAMRSFVVADRLPDVAWDGGCFEWASRDIEPRVSHQTNGLAQVSATKALIERTGDQGVLEIVPSDLSEEAGALLHDAGVAKAVVAPIVIADRVVGFAGLDFGVDATAGDLDPLFLAVGMITAIVELDAAGATQHLLAAIVESSADAVIGKTRDGIVTSWNRAAEEIYGYTTDEMLGTSVDVTVPQESRGALGQLRQRVGRGESVQVDTQGITKAGDIIDVWMSMTPIHNEAGLTVGIATLARDITAQRADERALIVANQQREEKAVELARSNHDLEMFAYVASHDLQEPLRMVASFVGLLARRYSDVIGDEGREFVAFAVDGATRMQILINDLLEYSRVGTRGLGTIPINSDDAVTSALANLNTAIIESGAVIEREPLPWILADETQLIQLFQNLIGNGIKFCDGGRPHIRISAALKGDECEFEVADDGVGIDPQFKERIFTIFQRLHTAREYPGTGIGLAVAKKIVERHNGRIWVESTLGTGSSFFFTMQLADQPVDQSNTTANDLIGSTK